MPPMENPGAGTIVPARRASGPIGLPPWPVAVLVGLVLATCGGYAVVSLVPLTVEQLRMRPVDPAQFHLDRFGVAPEGFAYYVTSTSAPAVVLDQGVWTHTPVAFRRVARAKGQWVVLVPDPGATHAEELGIFLRNEGGYWITATPTTCRDSAMGSEEWDRLWAEAEQVPAIGPRFADAIAR